MPSQEPPGRSSPPTARVVAVLDFLARHPRDTFGLSELARRLALSKPTCLGILTTLTESGYLLRDGADRTYRLGPALIALGHAAQESLRINPAAREELRRLSYAFDTTAALSAVVDDRITVLDVVGPPEANASVHAGQSYPFAPPVGLMFVLWDDVALRAWLAREPTIPSRTEGARLDQVIAECRTAGYLAERQTPAGRRLYALMAGMSDVVPQELRMLLGELVSDLGERVFLPTENPGDSRRHDISVISAPVYDHDQRQTMVLSLHVGRALTRNEIARRADDLIAGADALTKQLSGIEPHRR